MISNVEAAEAAHNALSETDEEYGRLKAYVSLSAQYTKIIKAQNFLKSSGTVAEKEATAFASQDFIEYATKLADETVEYHVLEAKRETWQREVDIWRTISANQRR
tara:strand:- start:2923 stop:3237 length:315 start_codon:yes stop_codon:yes gene_type:complete